MNIRDDSKKIVCYFLEQAVEWGDLDTQSSGKLFSYNTLAETLSLKDGRYCRVCCQYLREHGYITTHAKEDEPKEDELNIQRSVHLFSSAIDFLESA